MPLLICEDITRVPVIRHLGMNNLHIHREALAWMDVLLVCLWSLWQVSVPLDVLDAHMNDLRCDSVRFCQGDVYLYEILR